MAPHPMSALTDGLVIRSRRPGFQEQRKRIAGAAGAGKQNEVQ